MISVITEFYDKDGRLIDRQERDFANILEAHRGLNVPLTEREERLRKAAEIYRRNLIRSREHFQSAASELNRRIIAMENKLQLSEQSKQKALSESEDFNDENRRMALQSDKYKEKISELTQSLEDLTKEANKIRAKLLRYESLVPKRLVKPAPLGPDISGLPLEDAWKTTEDPHELLNLAIQAESAGEFILESLIFAKINDIHGIKSPEVLPEPEK